MVYRCENNSRILVLVVATSAPPSHASWTDDRADGRTDGRAGR